MAGCGGIFRTYRGFCKGYFSRPLGIMNTYEVEFLGIITTSEIAQQFKWSNLWLKCDSTYVVGLLRTLSKEVPWKWHAKWSHALNYPDTVLGKCLTFIGKEIKLLVD